MNKVTLFFATMLIITAPYAQARIDKQGSHSWVDTTIIQENQTYLTLRKAFQARGYSVYDVNNKTIIQLHNHEAMSLDSSSVTNFYPNKQKIQISISQSIKNAYLFLDSYKSRNKTTKDGRLDASIFYLEQGPHELKLASISKNLHSKFDVDNEDFSLLCSGIRSFTCKIGPAKVQGALIRNRK